MALLPDAISYISAILEDGALSLQDILSEIPLEDFLRENDDYFIIENGKVAVYDDLITGREEAVDYFSEELHKYNKAPCYTNFRGHIGQAGEDVRKFINTFYPNEEFKNFLLAHSDTFVVYDNDTVFLKEKASVNHFKDYLQNKGDGMYFRNLYGVLGQAPNYIKEYIKTYYPGEQFLDFLKNNSDDFFIDDKNCVYLNNDDESSEEYDSGNSYFYN